MEHTCSRNMDRFLALDKGQHIPLGVSLHLLSCKDCRGTVRALTRAESLAGSPLKVQSPVTDQSIQAVMEQVSRETAPKPRSIPIALWIAVGIFLIATMCVFSVFSSAIVNGRLEFWTYLLFAFALAAYLLMFVETNIDFFVKKTGIKKA